MTGCRRRACRAIRTDSLGQTAWVKTLRLKKQSLGQKLATREKWEWRSRQQAHPTKPLLGALVSAEQLAMLFAPSNG